ncbi:MAG: tRNA lysidine(34) synthetase TilS [Saprospiraceae bacterium]
MRKSSGFQFEQKIKAFLLKHNIPNDTTILVGLSGGPDSMCLINALLANKMGVLAAHVNYQLRGQASDEDEIFTKNWCKQKNINLLNVRWDTKKMASAAKTGIEETARKLRYNWFEKLCKKNKIQYVATGHHMNDQAETVLLQLIRGTGISGLQGILPVAPFPYTETGHLSAKLIRPLLSITKDEIDDYLRTKNIPFRKDASNEEDMFSRNKIRLNVVPILHQINNNASRHIAENAMKMQGIAPLINKAVEIFISKHTLKSGTKTKVFFDEEVNLQTAFYLLEGFGFNEDQVSQIFHCIAQKHKSRTFQSDNFTLFTLEKEVEIVKRKEEDFIELKLKRLPLSFKLQDQTIRFGKSKKIELDSLTKTKLDLNNIQLPLLVRRWQNGDKMQPLGMKGKSKKIKDILTDKKISGIEKQNAIVLVNQMEEIIWLHPTNTISELYKITRSTKNCLTIAII